MFSDSHGDLLTSGLGWAVWTDGRIKFTTGSGLPYKIRDIPVAPDITGLLRSGVLAPGSPSGVGDAAREGAADRPGRGESAGRGGQRRGRGEAGGRWRRGRSPRLPLTCENGEAILSISEKGWKVTEVADIPVKGRGGAGVGFHPFVNGEDCAAGGGGLGDRVRARQEGCAGREARQGVGQGFRRRGNTCRVGVRVSRLSTALWLEGLVSVPACAGRYRFNGEGVVDEDDCDGGGGGEGVGIENSVAGRSAIQEQRQLFAELFGVTGAGLARGFGEPRGKSVLVIAGMHACRVAGVWDFDGRRDERAKRRVNVEGGEESFAGCEVGAVEHFGQEVGIESA